MNLQKISSSFAKTLRERIKKKSPFRLSLPGCLHGRDPGWLEAEIVREVLGATQHVAWVDMAPTTDTIDPQRATTRRPKLRPDNSCRLNSDFYLVFL